jgi:pyrrolidone-carboxylate peptidase
MSSPSERHWLLTAFVPFAGRSVNNSESVLREVLRLSELEEDFGIRLHSHILPVEYAACTESLLTKIATLSTQGYRIEGVLSIGEGSEEFKIETRANNLDDVPDLADNAGVIRSKSLIFPELPSGETLPLRFPFEAFSRIRSSVNPGYFICNHLCARMAHLWSSPTDPWFGFIHVPRSGMGGMFTAEVCAAVILNGLKKLPTRSI